MKTKHLFFLLATVLLFSCTSLDDVNERLDEHEKRLNALETLVTNANTTISNLQKLVDAQGNKVSVVSYEMLADGSGYVLKMSDGTNITLKNGSDGDSPSVGVKEVDGVLYWTLNGEIMLDTEGNPIPAEGKDGEDGGIGITPRLRVDSEGYWEVSLDEGKRWERVKDANNNPVKAVGKDVDLEITEDENSITIVFNGETFVFPKGAGGSSGEQPEEPTKYKLALQYMALENLHGNPKRPESITFADSPFDMGWYYSWHDATTIPLPEGWHLPTRDEWRGIIPVKMEGIVNFTSPQTLFDVEEQISLGGETSIYKSDYKTAVQNASYGLRFKNENNEMLSAWKYEFTAIPEGESNEGYGMLKITARYLGAEKSNITIDEVADPAWWATNNTEDVVRCLPASGLSIPGTGPYANIGVYEYGYYWSVTEYTDTPFLDDDPDFPYDPEVGNIYCAWSVFFSNKECETHYNFGSANKHIGFSVRLFKDPQ